MRHRGGYYGPSLVAIVLVGLLFMWLGGSGCRQSSDQSKSKPVDLQKSIAQARENKQLVLLKFQANWCGPCHTLTDNIIPRKDVQKALDNWMVIAVDVDQHDSFANKHNISVIPTLVAMTPQEKVLGRLDGMVSVPQLIAFIQAAEKKTKRQTQPASG